MVLDLCAGFGQTAELPISKKEARSQDSDFGA